VRILVVGAGSIGGYFGGRLLEAGRDVTFLVRQHRADQLARAGLSIRSPFGNVHIPNPATISAQASNGPYDLILLSCKAYDLAGAIESFRPAVGPNTAILPLLNGVRHIQTLQAEFDPANVLGGWCIISVTLGKDGEVIHLNDTHGLSFGELDGSESSRTQAIAAAFFGARFEAHVSTNIEQELWGKWVFIATGAGITCLMRAVVGDIVEAGAAEYAERLLDEAAAIAALEGFPIAQPALDTSRETFTRPGSLLTASMLRDIERGSRTEADHVIGDLLRRGEEHDQNFPLLRVVYAQLRAYEARRVREAGEPTAPMARAKSDRNP
jgi:2-dehydropantoate 2-reductase